jgi:hypothetical protein
MYMLLTQRMRYPAMSVDNDIPRAKQLWAKLVQLCNGLTSANDDADDADDMAPESHQTRRPFMQKPKTHAAFHIIDKVAERGLPAWYSTDK